MYLLVILIAPLVATFVLYPYILWYGTKAGTFENSIFGRAGFHHVNITCRFTRPTQINSVTRILTATILNILLINLLICAGRLMELFSKQGLPIEPVTIPIETHFMVRNFARETLGMACNATYVQCLWPVIFRDPQKHARKIGMRYKRITCSTVGGNGKNLLEESFGRKTVCTCRYKKLICFADFVKMYIRDIGECSQCLYN